MARRTGARLVVIDVWRTRTARRADWFIPIRVGTDAALALGMAHVLHRDGLIDRDYIQRLVLGYERWSQEVLPRYTPAAVEAMTGVPAADVEALAHGLRAGQSAVHSPRSGAVTPCQRRRGDPGHRLFARTGRGLAAPWGRSASGHG